MPPARDPVERFWEKVEKTHSCWLWTGSLNGAGYGQLSIRNRPARAHRFIYELLVGPIPTGLFVCHTCDVRHCVRPDHLFLGDARDNSQDMLQKKREASRLHLRGESSVSRNIAGRRERKDRVLELLSTGRPVKDIALEVGMTRRAVYNIAQGRSWQRVFIGSPAAR